ncbi:hypothetical protein DSO57_1009753 [Entomophthora muscae]|uniref:Uncharacterized protein n=1 Tax=Entomophthora muscae TaxID=34485 RepID=A0ACC2RLC9_9FUNG|nr:hypothetical protein DSO57_1009753 [Entomophthora muscae]
MAKAFLIGILYASVSSKTLREHCALTKNRDIVSLSSRSPAEALNSSCSDERCLPRHEDVEGCKAIYLDFTPKTGRITSQFVDTLLTGSDSTRSFDGINVKIDSDYEIHHLEFLLRDKSRRHMITVAYDYFLARTSIFNEVAKSGKLRHVLLLLKAKDVHDFNVSQIGFLRKGLSLATKGEAAARKLNQFTLPCRVYPFYGEELADNPTFLSLNVFSFIKANLSHS